MVIVRCADDGLGIQAWSLQRRITTTNEVRNWCETVFRSLSAYRWWRSLGLKNERTGLWLLTANQCDRYDVGNNQFPLVTTPAKAFGKRRLLNCLAISVDFDNAEDFRKLGTKTWDANSEPRRAWLNNPYRKGEDATYGPCLRVQGRAWAKRWRSYRPTEEDCWWSNERYWPRWDLELLLAGVLWVVCVRLYSHHFSLLGDTLYLNSTRALVTYL